jgi:hypothetical protein
MGRLLKLIYNALPFQNFGVLFNHDAHSIVSKKGWVKIYNEGNHSGK